ncbi:MAG: HD domain-containing protein [Methanotrichaceae archaeon]|nr:HD domain-containing protein [Methanotrichaceae archaeon]
MTEIRDPVHGYIKLDDLAFDLMNTPQMQRLRWIKQLGLANLVYPGANHTRFEHSLGVYHLANSLANHLGLDEDETLKVGAAGLLHDIGHGPLSHATETVLEPYLRREHERIVDLLRKGELRDILDTFGLRPQEIQAFIDGDKLGQIVNSEIDVDRMDYLIRDAHYTGVAYGVIDHLRLMQKMKLHSGLLVVDSGGVQAATSLLISRLLMQPSVYFHHVCRISECMIVSGIRKMIEDGANAQEIKSMSDMEFFSAMINCGGYAKEIIQRILSRRLFKRAVYVGLENLDPSFFRSDERWLAQEISDLAKVDPDYVLLDNPAFPYTLEGDFPTVVGEEVKPLREVSPLVTMLEKAHRATWRFGVYCREEDIEKVSQAAMRCLDLKKNAVQHTFANID